MTESSGPVQQVEEQVRQLRHAYSLLVTAADNDPVRRQHAADVLEKAAAAMQESARELRLPSSPDSSPEAAALQRGVTRTRLVFAAGAVRTWPAPVVVHRVTQSFRRVSAGGQPVGIAASVDELLELLGAESLAEVGDESEDQDVVVEWRGGGPEVWPTAPLQYAMPDLSSSATDEVEESEPWDPSVWNGVDTPGLGSRLGPGERDVDLCDPVIHERGCWQCGAEVGEPCRKISEARRLRGAHGTRYSSLTSVERESNRRAVRVPCPHCGARRGVMCHTVPRGDGGKRSLRTHVHAERRRMGPAT